MLTRRVRIRVEGLGEPRLTLDVQPSGLEGDLEPGTYQLFLEGAVGR